MRIGLFGGTFDPPHLAHLVVAEAAYCQLGLDEVWLIPAGAPWQKQGTLSTPAHHRWAMTEAAAAPVSYLKSDDREVVRSGPTYTFDTLSELAEYDLTLILGADAASRISSWYRSDDLLKMVEVAVAPRPGVSRNQVDDVPGLRVRWLDVPHLDISGTDLRKRAAAGHSLRFLVPEAVREYIQQHHLYSLVSRATRRAGLSSWIQPGQPGR